jgi:hypothetical protein
LASWLVLRLGGLRLRELRLQRARVELREQLAGLHVLPFDEADLVELAVDARLHGHGGHRGDGADARAVDLHVLRRDARGGHLHRRRLGRLGLGGVGRCGA